MSGVATMSASEFKMDCAIGIGIFRATKPDGTVVAVKLINRALPRVESTRKHLESLLAEVRTCLFWGELFFLLFLRASFM
jgi:hypothetical protein